MQPTYTDTNEFPSRFTNASTLLACLLAASGSSLALADSAVIPFVEDGAITADGVMHDGEWSRATHLTGFRQVQKDRLVSRDAEICLAADGKSLHVAATTPTEGSETDGGFVAVGEDGTVQVCKDDCFEFFLANEPGGAATNVYQILITSRGAKYEIGRGASKADGLGKTTIATRVHGGYWYVEASIPWTKVPGIDPRRFRFNAARSFVRAGYGYASLTAQRYPYDASKYWSVAVKDGFGGVQVKGLDSSLSSGRFRLEAITPGAKSEIKARLFKGDRTVLVNDPAREQKIPSGDDWMAATAEVYAKGFGKVYHHAFLPFELGKSAGNFPVTMKKRIDDLGTVFLRFYPCASKAAVVVDGMPSEAKQAEASVTGPDGATATAPLVAQPDGTFKAMVALPPERTRAAGLWKGRVAFVPADGRRREFADAFEFTERKFPWQHNRIGYSSKVLAPFTPIEMERQPAADGAAGWTLRTVLREHRLGADGLLAGAKSKGDEIFAAPFTFRAKVNGKRESFAAERFDVLEALPNGVRLRAVGSFGPMRFTADVAWDYDGFALVTGTMSPVAKTTVEELTIVAPMKKVEATLFHALVDMTRGNPAGLIPEGDGVVWDSSRLKRRANDMGMPNFPGEFTPYVWFGGEEKGLALLFDSPKGYDLEDGKPMVRIVRAADRVTCECDVVSRAHELAKPTTFQFGYQVTPVKPLQEGSELWVPQYGNRLPGMVHISPIVTGANFGLYPQGFLKTPTNTNNWIQAKAFRKAMRTRRIDYKALEYIHGEGDRQTAEWAERNRDLYARSYHKSGDTFRRRLLMYQHDQLTRDAMTLDRAIAYSCATLFSNTADDAYNYYRAEWYTMQPWGAGMTDRVFLTPDTVDYLVWTYRDLLKNGADGINFDETFVVSQTNPDLSEVRDYKGRVIPETGILAARGMMRRMAHLMDDMGFKERLLAPHLTNTMIIPEFAFCNIGICWEYGTYGNFIDLFPPDYCRAHSSGLQAGLRQFALFCYENDPMRGKIPRREYCERRNRSFRTALAMSLQHQIQPMQRYWGDFTEQYWARYVLWAFGTHKKDCAFMPYWGRDNPFSVSEGFIAGAYRRGSSVLFVVSNLGKKATARIAFDPKALGLGANAKAMMIGPPFGNCRKPDELALSSDERIVNVEIPDFEYKFVFVGAGEFGEMLAPPDPDMGFIID